MHRLLATLAAAALTMVSTSAARAQRGFFAHWQARTAAAQATQPHWVTPLATTTPLLEQEFRADFDRHIAPSGAQEWTYGSGKGLELIPAHHIELLFNIPSYNQHNSPAVKDGFGDTTLMMKYRVFARNERHGNSVVTAFLAGTIPTGSYSNGSTDASLTPTLGAGKGFGRFDAQSTLGATLPVANADKLGRPIAWNTALQYHAGPNLWPEVEFNATFYNGGSHDGQTQNFIMPGIVGHWKLHNRLGITLGAGMQIATSAHHAYNHGLILSARIPF